MKDPIILIFASVKYKWEHFEFIFELRGLFEKFADFLVLWLEGMSDSFDIFPKSSSIYLEDFMKKL